MLSAAENARGRRKARVEQVWSQRLLDRQLANYPAAVIAALQLAAQREQREERAR